MDLYDVKFKGERKVRFIDDKQTRLMVGDSVVVDAEKGEDIGVISSIRSKEALSQAELDKFKEIRRKASDEDMERSNENHTRETDAFKLCNKKIKEHDLAMKLVDVEYQFDRNKITFYFTAEKRIDFRALVKDLASIYNTRIELRQIGVRDEARRIGGYGHCGIKLCCAAFKEEFEPVTTKMARDQLLSVNPRKLSGACGRLMCCLEYEHKFYKEELKDFPEMGNKVKTSKGEGYVHNIDLFKRSILIRYKDGTMENSDVAEVTILDKSVPRRRGGNRNGK